MATFRLGTFNVENLFARYKFEKGEKPFADDAGFTINDLAFDIFDETEKKITAQAIREVNADVLCLQEVESLPVLDRFKGRYLQGMHERYDYRLLVDGNDPRAIDVAVMARKPIRAIRSHRHERSEAHPTQPLFSRDLLEVDVDLGENRTFTVFVNHFKSMMEGRAQTRDRRLEQTRRVANVLRARYGDCSTGNFAVVGDFNDYFDSEESSSLGSLIGPHSELKLVNIVANLPEKERWTHFFARKHEYKQLDYILLPQSLGDLTPSIMRRGQPLRAGDFHQFPDVGENDPKASDHCPVLVDVPVDRLV
ncbi:MAG TPA: endonuclease/exonuclease/phosphatase family protein [Anaeromyxobacter sp.]